MRSQRKGRGSLRRLPLKTQASALCGWEGGGSRKGKGARRGKDGGGQRRGRGRRARQGGVGVRAGSGQGPSALRGCSQTTSQEAPPHTAPQTGPLRVPTASCTHTQVGTHPRPGCGPGSQEQPAPRTGRRQQDSPGAAAHRAALARRCGYAGVDQVPEAPPLCGPAHTPANIPDAHEGSHGAVTGQLGHERSSELPQTYGTLEGPRACPRPPRVAQTHSKRPSLTLPQSGEWGFSDAPSLSFHISSHSEVSPIPQTPQALLASTTPPGMGRGGSRCRAPAGSGGPAASCGWASLGGAVHTAQPGACSPLASHSLSHPPILRSPPDAPHPRGSGRPATRPTTTLPLPPATVPRGRGRLSASAANSWPGRRGGQQVRSHTTLTSGSHSPAVLSGGRRSLVEGPKERIGLERTRPGAQPRAPAHRSRPAFPGRGRAEGHIKPEIKLNELGLSRAQSPAESLGLTAPRPLTDTAYRASGAPTRASL